MMSNKELSVYHYCSSMGLDELRCAFVGLSLKHDELFDSLSRVSPFLSKIKSLDAVIVENSRVISVGNSLGTTIDIDWLRKNNIQKGDIIKQLTFKL